MAKVKDLILIMQAIAPEQYTYDRDYDNVGLMVGDEQTEVTKVLCCLDVTEHVLDEAIAVGAQLIISHHPMIFGGIKNVTASSSLGKKIIKAIKNGISVYSAHTNLDFVKGGINDYLAELLNLTDVVPLEPYISAQEGFGRIGNIKETTAKALKEFLMQVLDDDYISIIGEPDALINRIAIINGAGGGDIAHFNLAKKLGADSFLTGEVKHHVAIFARENGITVFDAQHFTLEHVYISRLVEILKTKLIENNCFVDIMQSQSEVNPRF